MDTSRDTARTEEQLKQEAEALLESGSAQSMRHFLESVPGTKERRMRNLRIQQQKKQAEKRRKNNRKARQARAKNRGRS